MKPTGPIPPHFFANDAGELLIGGLARRRAGCRSRRHAARSSTTTISSARRSPRLRGGDAGRSCAILFCKRKSLRAVARTSWEDMSKVSGSSRVASWSVSSRRGLPASRMTFAGPGKLDDELEAGIEAGATISVESEGRGRPRNQRGRAGRDSAEARGPGQSALLDREWPCYHGRSSPARSASMRSAFPLSSRA